MPRDSERIQRISDALQEANLDALVCALPVNVLMLTGYWPVVGTSIAIVVRDSRVIIIAPEDELQIAASGGADEVKSFKAGSLIDLLTVADAIHDPFRDVINRLGLSEARIGYEYGGVSQPVTYAAMHLYGCQLHDLLKDACATATLCPADDLLTRQRAVKTSFEISRIRTACVVARKAFLQGGKELNPGLTEIEAANLFRNRLTTPSASDQAKRVDGFAYCMSGANGAEAYAAYQLSRARELRREDLAVIHCNSYVDGYWTDITRTFAIGDANERQRAMYNSVFAARDAALATIRPGVSAVEVDSAARDVMRSHGFDREFRHGLGHSVGFEAIDHNAPPRLHPQSRDVLETGMVFNIEPAIYVDGECGLRHCDMVALSSEGVEVLTPFQSTLEQLIV